MTLLTNLNVRLFTGSAFVSPSSFTRNSIATRSSPQPCICMKAKRSTGAKRSAKNKRSSVSEPKSTKSDKPKAFGNKNGAMQTSEDSTQDGDVEVEKVSGGAGDETPHRALVPEAPSKTMQNPQEGSLGEEREPLVLPLIGAQELKKMRFERGMSLDETVEKFRDAKLEGELIETVMANRDFVTENLLYRFTSAILQVENRTERLETIEEEARNMRSLRQELIGIAWSMDYPMKVEVQKAEARLVPVLQGDNVRRGVQQNCGYSNIEVDAFWIVIFAAIAAWEERGKENPQLVNVDMQKQLSSAAESCGSLDYVLDRLSPSLQSLQNILSVSDPEVQKQVVEELNDDTVTQLGIYTEQVRLLPFAAYGALTVRMDAIMDYIMRAKYNIEPTKLDPLRFKPPPLVRESKLVDIQKNNAERVRRERQKSGWF